MIALVACGCGGHTAQSIVVWGTTATAGATALAGGWIATRRARRRPSTPAGVDAPDPAGGPDR